MKNRSDDLARAYVEAHGLTAIIVEIGRAGASLRSIGYNSKAGRTPFPWAARIEAAWWVADDNTAGKVMTAAGSSADAETLIGRALMAAERARVRLTDHDVLMRRAAQAVQLVETRLRDLKSTGGMKALNTEYRDLRLRRQETGRTIEPFWQWIHRRKVAMVEQVARAASGRRK